MRAGLLDQFPASVPITVVATGTNFYAYATTRRTGLTLLPLAVGEPLPPIADSNVIVDGLDLLDDPAAALRELRRATSSSRVFALVSNGAYGTTLLRFLAGGSLPAAHPLVAAEIEPLFTAGGWTMRDRTPLLDRSIAHGPVPYAMTEGGITLAIATEKVAERLSTAGFLVIADPQ
jgi:hypothetical protein